MRDASLRKVKIGEAIGGGSPRFPFQFSGQHDRLISVTPPAFHCASQPLTPEVHDRL